MGILVCFSLNLRNNASIFECLEFFRKCPKSLTKLLPTGKKNGCKNVFKPSSIGLGQGGDLTMQVPNPGWLVDSTWIWPIFKTKSLFTFRESSCCGCQSHSSLFLLDNVWIDPVLACITLFSILHRLFIITFFLLLTLADYQPLFNSPPFFFAPAGFLHASKSLFCFFPSIFFAPCRFVWPTHEQPSSLPVASLRRFEILTKLKPYLFFAIPYKCEVGTASLPNMFWNGHILNETDTTLMRPTCGSHMCMLTSC